MNCKQFNDIKLDEILNFLGYVEAKSSEKEAWFLNPFSTERDPSFKYDRYRNQWHLFSEGVGGNNVDFIRKYFRCSIQEALEWARSQNFSSFHHQSKISQPNYAIREVLPLTNWNLKKYLKSRGLTSKVHKYLNEVKFTMGSMKLYAIGFKNNAGGYELRNSFYKGAILKKDLSLINNDSKTICVFEGFLDAMSYIELASELNEDLLVLNSISLVSKAKEFLKKYEEIRLFLDNDKSGKETTNSLLECFSNAVNCSVQYQKFHDLNDFLKHK